MGSSFESGEESVQANRGRHLYQVTAPIGLFCSVFLMHMQFLSLYFLPSPLQDYHHADFSLPSVKVQMNPEGIGQA